jgi:hypothetical protein
VIAKNRHYDPLVLSSEEIRQLLSAGYELRGFELKGPGLRTDSHLFAKVARAALGLGNLRDGGHIVIGIDDADPAAMGPGLDQQQLASWLDYDSVAQKLAVYADPPVRFDLASRELSSGATVVVIEVAEFSDLPHLCAKDYEGVLRRGALYVRPRKMPETSEVASSVEMRDVLLLATEKALRAYVEVAERARVGLSTTEDASDAEQFASQREGWR